MHRENMVHTDIKPENLMVDLPLNSQRLNQAKIYHIDFGMMA